MLKFTAMQPVSTFHPVRKAMPALLAADRVHAMREISLLDEYAK
jgi:hypothetical protein